jgi:ribonuclease HI
VEVRKIKLKILCDASYKREEKKAGVSIVVKYSDTKKGKYNYLISLNDIVKADSSTESEALAVYKAIRYIHESQDANKLYQQYRILIYSDNLTVVRSLNKGIFINEINNDTMTNILNDLKELRVNYMVQLLWISRKENQEAHQNARSVLKAGI